MAAAATAGAGVQPLSEGTSHQLLEPHPITIDTATTPCTIIGYETHQRQQSQQQLVVATPSSHEQVQVSSRGHNGLHSHVTQLAHCTCILILLLLSAAVMCAACCCATHSEQCGTGAAGQP